MAKNMTKKIQKLNRLNEDLLKAANTGDLQLLFNALKNGADVNYRNSIGFNPLYNAVKNNHAAAVILLLEHGADPNSIGPIGHSALMLATDIEKTEIFDILVGNNKINLNNAGPEGKTALHLAVEKANIDAIQKLVQMGADLCVRDFTGKTALHLAVEKANIDAIQKLVQMGADLCVRDFTGKTARDYAIKMADKNILKALTIELHADINPLAIALNEKDFKKIASLINENDQKSNLTNRDLKAFTYITPKNNKINIRSFSDVLKVTLHFAAKNGYVDAIRKIVLCNIDINTWFDDETALYTAAKYGHLEAVQELLAHGPIIDCATNKELTPLIVSIINGHEEIVELFLNKGADINFISYNGSSPLHFAVLSNKPNMVKTLIKYGADIHNKDNKYMNPPEYAIMDNLSEIKKIFEGTEEISEKFSEEGINYDEIISNGFNPLHVACQLGNLDLVKLLTIDKSEINVENKRGETPLIICAINGRVQVAEYLLEQGANVNLEGFNNATPLHYAVLFNMPTMTKLFISHGAKINALDEDRQRPLDFAERGNYKEIIALLTNQPKKALSAEDKYQLLNDAIKDGDLVTLNNLDDCEIDFNMIGSSGTAPLHEACILGNVEVVEFLINKGANVNILNISRETPLHKAAYHGHEDIVSTLLKNGADPRALTTSFETPYDYAKYKNNPELASFIMNFESSPAKRKISFMEQIEQGAEEFFKNRDLTKSNEDFLRDSTDTNNESFEFHNNLICKEDAHNNEYVLTGKCLELDLNCND